MRPNSDLNIPQLKASDPNISVWAMASAGTGKTKVLIDRLMKLLVTGANPQKVLCLTFTKAAANEIKFRINQELEKWSKSNDDELQSLLEKLFGSGPKKQFLLKAKNLLNELFKLPEPIKICTIHAFCQHVLKKFPIEAGISPTFRVIDELLMKQVIAKLKKELFSDEFCTNAIKFFAQNFHETTIDEILHGVISGKFLTLTDTFSNSQEYKNHLAQKTGIAIELEEEILKSYVLDIPVKHKIFLQNDHPKDVAIINSINAYLALSLEQQMRRWRDLMPIFLTSEQNKRMSILSKKTKDLNAQLVELLERWQSSFTNLVQKIAHHTAIKASCYLYEIASILLAKYQNFKIYKGYLDYEDLIFFTNKLLSQSADKEWVLYKLDGGIDHILVDEAQDTSTAQWQVIQNLISDFFSGQSRQIDRTVFVVGDEKQSIYSFQGADVKALQNTKQFIENGMKNARKNHQSVELTNCYRSTQVIVDFIQKSLSKSNANFRVPDLQSMRFTNLGRVELWPMLPQIDQKKDVFWPSPTEIHKLESSKAQISKIIASYIKNLLSQKIVLPSTKAAIKESDITILVQRRNVFTNLLIDSLRHEGLAVCGLDRIKLQSNLSVLDIVAIAKFALLPSDHLNCAIVLKSPLFNLKENELYEVAHAGEIWNNLCCSTNPIHKQIALKLQEILKLSVNYSVSDFFFLLLDCLGLRYLLLDNNSQSDDQVIDEFLQVAKRFESEIGGNLYNFVDWFANNELDAKRDPLSEEGIKIMTVHAAKGLESSVVILPDATSPNIDEHRICWIDDDCVLFLPREKSDLISQYKALEQEKSCQEYLRLMYVALSRCKDYLIICSDSAHKEARKDSWYSIASEAIKQLGVSVKSELLEELGIKENIWVMQSQEFEICQVTEEFRAPDKKPSTTTQQWVQKQHNATKIFTPALSPLEKENESVLYGSIIHKILEEAANGARYTEILNHPLLFKFSSKKRTETISRLTNLFNTDFWQDLLNRKVYTELPFFDHKEGKSFVGRIDLLAISESEVRIIDYKTDASVPKSEKDIPKKYLEQMHRYKTAISKIYPNHKVSAFILWFESCSLFPLT
jgi:ATP-dependent helicase/nuclease subunit A